MGQNKIKIDQELDNNCLIFNIQCYSMLFPPLRVVQISSVPSSTLVSPARTVSPRYTAGLAAPARGACAQCPTRLRRVWPDLPEAVVQVGQRGGREM